MQTHALILIISKLGLSSEFQSVAKMARLTCPLPPKALDISDTYTIPSPLLIQLCCGSKQHFFFPQLVRQSCLTGFPHTIKSGPVDQSQLCLPRSSKTHHFPPSSQKSFQSNSHLSSKWQPYPLGNSASVLTATSLFSTWPREWPKIDVPRAHPRFFYL